MKDIESPSELKALVDSVNKAVTTHSLLVGGVTSRSESITHNVASPDEIKKQIMLLMTSLASDGIEIEPLEKEDKGNRNSIDFIKFLYFIFPPNIINKIKYICS